MQEPFWPDIKRTIISQYANSPILNYLINEIDRSHCTNNAFDNFYLSTWDIDTAYGVGLDIWGRIVGLSRSIIAVNGAWFGFSEETALMARPYNDPEGVFYDGQDQQEDKIIFDDATYRKLISIKAAANISDNSLPSLNNLLHKLFGRDHYAFVRDGNDMTMTVIFTWLPSRLEASIIVNAGVFPKPAGVTIQYEILI